MNSKRSREGYLLIDHRYSPGMPADLMVAMGMDPAAGRGTYESATVTCCHCGTVVILRPDRSRPRGHCWKCDSYVCDNPGCNAECKPLSKVFDDLESAAIHGRNLNPETVFTTC